MVKHWHYSKSKRMAVSHSHRGGHLEHIHTHRNNYLYAYGRTRKALMNHLKVGDYMTK